MNRNEKKRTVNEEKLLTLPEAAEILRFHVKTVRRMAIQKMIPGVRFGHVWRFDAAVLRQWFADQSAQSARFPRIWDK